MITLCKVSSSTSSLDTAAMLLFGNLKPSEVNSSTDFVAEL
jgi:hypothetical protein